MAAHTQDGSIDSLRQPNKRKNRYQIGCAGCLYFPPARDNPINPPRPSSFLLLLLLPSLIELILTAGDIQCRRRHTEINRPLDGPKKSRSTDILLLLTITFDFLNPEMDWRDDRVSGGSSVKRKFRSQLRRTERRPSGYSSSVTSRWHWLLARRMNPPHGRLIRNRLFCL